MKVIIVGGGISGLSQALSLHQVGIACRVYEAVPVLEPLGYGINLQPNAVRELFALGLGEKLTAAGILTQELAYYNKHGQLIWREVRGEAAGYRWPQISISRAELHKIILGAINERLGASAILTARRLNGFEKRGEKVIARFVDASGKPADEAEGDILIGADGIHSAVRAQLYPGERAVSDGYLHYRGIVEAKPYLTGASMAVIGHGHHRAIVYPIMQGQGGDVINWLAYTKIPAGAPPLEAWDAKADKNDCIAQFEGWSFPWLDVHGLFQATEDARVLQLPNIDRNPVPRWSFGRVTLIGDAAHPMQPMGAQAGSQAIVDGRVLTAALMAHRDPIDALESYQNERIAAMNDLVIRNRSLGPEAILRIAEERAPDGFTDIHDVLSRQELEDTAARFKLAAGLDVETVNRQRSLVEIPELQW